MFVSTQELKTSCLHYPRFHIPPVPHLREREDERTQNISPQGTVLLTVGSQRSHRPRLLRGSAYHEVTSKRCPEDVSKCLQFTARLEPA